MDENNCFAITSVGTVPPYISAIKILRHDLCQLINDFARDYCILAQTLNTLTFDSSEYFFLHHKHDSNLTFIDE